MNSCDGSRLFCQIGLGISPIKQRPHNVPQKQLDLRRSALKNERSGSAQKRPDSVPKQLFATHRENQGCVCNMRFFVRSLTLLLFFDVTLMD